MLPWFQTWLGKSWSLWVQGTGEALGEDQGVEKTLIVTCVLFVSPLPRLAEEPGWRARKVSVDCSLSPQPSPFAAEVPAPPKLPPYG